MRSSMVRNRLSSMKPRTGCMPRRAFWPGVCTPTPEASRAWRACSRATRPRIPGAELYIGLMTDPQIAIPSRAPSATTADDTVMPFEVAKLDLRGRVVRLGPLVDEILARHAYPQPVAKLLGEAVVLAIMLGSALKIDGRF